MYFCCLLRGFSASALGFTFWIGVLLFRRRVYAILMNLKAIKVEKGEVFFMEEDFGGINKELPEKGLLIRK